MRSLSSAPQRNRQVVRQWQILRRLAAARTGNNLYALAGYLGVSTRTIRRDLEALQAAGFPLVDAIEDVERRVVWRLMPTRDVATLSALELAR